MLRSYTVAVFFTLGDGTKLSVFASCLERYPVRQTVRPIEQCRILVCEDL